MIKQNDGWLWLLFKLSCINFVERQDDCFNGFNVTTQNIVLKDK